MPVLILFVVGIAGYFGGWVPHRAAGLVVTGLDLAEYVKFLPPVMSGQIPILREAFYAPLLAASLFASVVASRRSLPRWLRLGALLPALPLALAMLPPGWSPGLLLQPAFRIQVLAIGMCVAAVPLIWLIRYLPDGLVLFLVALLFVAAALWPAWSFVQVLEPIRDLYRDPALLGGWGLWAMLAGYLGASLFAVVAALRQH